MTSPPPIAHGRRVSLRPFTAADITARYVGWLNDPEVVKYSSQRFVTHTPASCLAYLQTFASADNLFLAIDSIASQQLIGTMTAYMSADGASADLGILVGDRTVWGSGVGSDAWSSLMQYLVRERGIVRITGGTVVENHAMRRIMEKAGMRLESTRAIQERGGGERQAHLFSWTNG